MNPTSIPPLRSASLILALCAAGCAPTPGDHGPYADGIMAPLGQPLPSATEAQRATFERGLAVMQHRFSREEGLGPAFNVTFCGACHEKPVFGGSAGTYRNFFIGQIDEPGPANGNGMSAGAAGGVVRLYHYDKLPERVAAHAGEEGCTDEVMSPYARPPVDPAVDIVAQRNAIPFWGAGLMAELYEDAIYENWDPDDLDGDGISGDVNLDEIGAVGRFGMKSQTSSVEGFIRGPLFNHLGITTNPLTCEERNELPIDSCADGLGTVFDWVADTLSMTAQAAAPQGPTVDEDCVPDPEMPNADLFDLVAAAMLMAAPQFDEPTEQTEHGAAVFDTIGCNGCHVPRLEGPRGLIPLYSDLLLHDLGEDNADGLEMRSASGSEFKTQPLWGIAATAPYLHDGRADTIEQAIEAHGGEATTVREAWRELDGRDQEDLVEFLLSLGGRDQASPGLLPPDAPVPATGEYGGPVRPLEGAELSEFVAARGLFDHEFGKSIGLGGPRFNGDSCRACHFEPTIGGAGPRGVNVVRHGVLNEDGSFVTPSVGTVLHRVTSLKDTANKPQTAAAIFELRQTPHLFGLGLIDAIAEETILANADPDDLDQDGISGKASWVDGGRLGRFGWKASVPNIDEFVRDAVSMELGMTLPFEDGKTFGRIQDNDSALDPEFPAEQAHLLATFMRTLGPPPRQAAADEAAAQAGEVLFGTLGCAACHVPALEGPDGPVPLFSDLLLHDMLPEGALGIEEASATMREFRTAPLWGVSQTPPYLHDGRADTLHQAILGHDGEATTARAAYAALSEAEQADLHAFLGTL